MEPANMIVMKQLIEQHKPTRMLAIAHKNAMHAQRQAVHQAAVAAAAAAGQPPPPAPEVLGNVSLEVMQATDAEIRGNEAAHQQSVDRYYEMVKQYDKHN